MRVLLSTSLLLLGSTVIAQIFPPRSPQEKPPFVAELYLSASAHTPIYRQVGNGYAQDAQRPRISPSGGVDVLLWSRSSRALYLSLDYLIERTKIIGVNREFLTGGIFIDETPIPAFVRKGDYSVKESWLRFRSGVRLGKGRIRTRIGGQFSILQRSLHQYQFEQITEAFYDLNTGISVPLRTEIRTPGELIIEKKEGGYLGLMLGLDYCLHPDWSIALSTDWGLFLNTTYISEHQRGRLSLMVNYRIVGR